MISFNLQWSLTKLSQLDNEVYAHFFMLESNGKVLYIGNVYHENLTATISAAYQSHGLDERNVKVYLGRIREYGQRGISQVAMESMHNLLVFASRPRYNRELKLAYTGLADLKIANSGVDILPVRVRAENRIVFLRMRPQPSVMNYNARQAG